MKDNEIKIIVASQSGMGKTTVAKAIYDALFEKGFTIEFKDDDVGIDDKFFDKDFQNKRIANIKDNILVNIETRLLRRNIGMQ